MIPTLFSFIFSLGVVILGAKLFLGAAVSLSRLWRLPEMVIGATVVSLATTMPETLVSVFASVDHHSSLALGNVIGSGLVNLGFLFGFVLLVAPKDEAVLIGRGRRRNLILFSLILFIYLWLLIFKEINLLGGLLLILCALVFLGYTFWYALRRSGENLGFLETKLETHPQVILKFLLGVFLLILGSRFLVESGVELARVLALPEVVIGITLIAVGTSLPELITALAALRLGHQRMSLGNLTGATVLTFTLALGLAAIITEVKITPDLLKLDFPALLLFSGLALIFAFFPKLPQKVIGGTLILGYFTYLIFLFWL